MFLLLLPFCFFAYLWCHSFIVYPLCMIALSRRKADTSLFFSGDLPSVTLIIPAHNEERVIAQKIENFFSIDYPETLLNALVASDGSSDTTVLIAKKYACDRLKILDFTERRGKTSIVNDAVATATGEIVCLCDANVMFEPTALRTLVLKLLSDNRIGAVTGDVRLRSHESDFGEGETLYYAMERRVQLGESAIGSTMGVDGGMYVLRRKLFEPPHSSTILDDFVISMRVIMKNFRVVYEPLAIAHENGTPTSAAEYRRRVRVTAGAIQTLYWRIWPSPVYQFVPFVQWFSHKLLRWFSPLWLLLSLVFLVALSFFNTYALLAVIVVAIPLLLGTAGALFPTLRTWPIVGSCHYFFLSNRAILEGLVTGIFQRQAVTWNRTQR